MIGAQSLPPSHGRTQPQQQSTARLLAGPPLADGTESHAAHVARLGPLPGRIDPGALVAEIERSGLLGRGGAAFPAGTKWRAVAGRASGGAVVVANGAEGEPRSHKDRALMAARPHLVIDGGLLAARAVGAGELVLYVGSDHHAAIASMRRALAERRGDALPIRLMEAPARYVAGESSAVVHFLNEGDARPTAVPPRPYVRGVGGRATLVQNVESLAHAALIGRFGAEWYRSAGRDSTPGTALVTVQGADGMAKVAELEYGTTLRELAASLGHDARDHRAVLLGGYFGGWATVDAVVDVPLDPARLTERGLAFGCGLVALLPAGTCGVQATAGVLRYMAGESARQCGPCVFGLGAISAAADRLAERRHAPDDLENLGRWANQVQGRGGCHHPDGAAGLLVSALEVFHAEFRLHQATRRCSADGTIGLAAAASGPGDLAIGRAA
ncbi:MAG: hypothetical protein QOH61_2227 [Chloroflexota bacterium]|jgi:NADH:ubiquinone oxidoreductase subunit F (NADH-binding)|nr:hypothetical protein [Chloroflexota bacterium]